VAGAHPVEGQRTGQAEVSPQACFNVEAR